MKRILGLGVVVLVAAVGAAVWFGISRLDGLVADAIETYGSEIAGVPVRVASVTIDLGEGRGTIAGLRVGNPEGYSPGDAFSLGEITLDIDTDSLTASPIVIDALTIAAPEARYEMNAKGVANFDVIRDNVKRYSKAGPDAESEGAPDSDTGDDAEGESLLLAVRKFRFEDGSVTTDVSALHPEAEAQTLELPAVGIDDLGGSAGVPPGEIGAEVLGAFTKSVRKAASRALKNEARKVLEDIGGDAGKAAGDLLDKLF